jgi:hypothetical protein
MAERQAADRPDMSRLLVDKDIDGDLEYIKDGKVTERPVLTFDKLEITADDTDVARLEVGQPFVAEIDGETYEIQSGILELTSPMPARYRVRILQFPYRDLDVEVVAK